MESQIAIDYSCHNQEYPAVKPGVIIGVKVVTSICCCVSIAGACWIILTYFIFKNLRTTARQLLVNLSIADILIAGSHWVGTLVNYDRFMPYLNGNLTVISHNDSLCVSQAAFTLYGSISSFLWTMSIAFYMLLVALSVRKTALKVVVVVIYIVSWGMPVPILIASAVQKYLGFQYTGATSCYTVDAQINGKTRPEIIASEVLSYEVWVYLAYLFLPIAYISVFVYLRCSKANRATALAATRTDIKLLLVPISFLFLRVWTTIADAIAFYAQPHEIEKFHCSQANAVLIFFQNIGINSQGTVNAILFCLLTRQVRLRWYLTLKRLCKCGRSEDETVHEELLDETLDDSYSEADLGKGKGAAVSTYGSVNSKPVRFIN